MFARLAAAVVGQHVQRDHFVARRQLQLFLELARLMRRTTDVAEHDPFLRDGRRVAGIGRHERQPAAGDFALPARECRGPRASRHGGQLAAHPLVHATANVVRRRVRQRTFRPACGHCRRRHQTRRQHDPFCDSTHRMLLFVWSAVAGAAPADKNVMLRSGSRCAASLPSNASRALPVPTHAAGRCRTARSRIRPGLVECRAAFLCVSDTHRTELRCGYTHGCVFTYRFGLPQRCPA